MAQPLSRGGENEIVARILAVLRKHLSELTANSLLESALEKTGLPAAKLQQADVARLLPALERGARLFMRSQADAEEAMKGLIKLAMAREEKPAAAPPREEPPTTRRNQFEDSSVRWSPIEPPTMRRTVPDDSPPSRRPTDDPRRPMGSVTDEGMRAEPPTARRSTPDVGSGWSRPEHRSDARPEGRAGSEPRLRAHAEIRPEPRPEARPEPRIEPRAEPRPEPRRPVREERRGEVLPVQGPAMIVEIRREDDIVRARSEARRMAERLGATVSLQTQLATVVSELARNIFLYAGGRGHIELCPLATPRRGVDVVARDQGPGIADVALVLEGNYRSKLGMGLGLRGVRRLASYFELNSVVGVGTTVRAQLRVE